MSDARESSFELLLDDMNDAVSHNEHVKKICSEPVNHESNAVVELNSRLPVSEVGGKAHSLSVLCNNGFNIPRGFVVTASAFFDFLNYNGSCGEILKLASEINRDNFKEKAALARKAILGGELPGRIISEIDRLLKRSNLDAVSVRSSAVSEDGSNLSFAGLFDSYLNRSSELSAALDAVKNCWSSLFNDQAVAYRIRKGMRHVEGMAVIVQKMIPAEISGITFTVHPLHNESTLIETSYGLGDMIVSGRIDPDDFTVDRKTFAVVQKRIGNKDKMAVCRDSKVEVVEVEKELMKTQALPDSRLKEIGSVCLKIEKMFNRPQDIEWCLCNNELWILQSRPITVMAA